MVFLFVLFVVGLMEYFDLISFYWVELVLVLIIFIIIILIVIVLLV